MPTAKPTRRALVCLTVLIVFSAGCAQRVKLGRVSGRVTYKGQPVPNGAITFLPSPSGPPATAAIRSDGTYALQTPDVGDGAVLGKHAVMITALRVGPAMGPEEKDPLPPPIIPVKYGNTSTSGLTAEVQEGDNTIDFELLDDKTTPKK
jgi:hypothetical protein